MPLPRELGDFDAVLGGDPAHERRALRANALLEAAGPARAGAAGADWAIVGGNGDPLRRAAARPRRAAGAEDAAGEAATGAAAVSVAPFSVSIRATTVWTVTVFPSPTMISARTPADGDGISASTLSVEISKIGSSRFTSSPTFLSQRETVPSAIDSPIWGMMTSTRATTTSPD